MLVDEEGGALDGSFRSHEVSPLRRLMGGVRPVTEDELQHVQRRAAPDGVVQRTIYLRGGGEAKQQLRLSLDHDSDFVRAGAAVEGGAEVLDRRRQQQRLSVHGREKAFVK
jgi:hypothetical protein